LSMREVYFTCRFRVRHKWKKGKQVVQAGQLNH